MLQSFDSQNASLSECERIRPVLWTEITELQCRFPNPFDLRFTHTGYTERAQLEFPERSRIAALRNELRPAAFQLRRHVYFISKWKELDRNNLLI